MKKEVGTRLDLPDSQMAQSGLIPGLYVYDDILTEKEQNNLIYQIDSKEWIKMHKRR